MSDQDSGMTVRDVLSSLARGTSVLVSHPSAAAKLRELGLDVEVQPALSAEESIDRLFEERKAQVLGVLDLVPPIPPALPAAVVLLYKEMIECLLFGLHGAAITLAGVLVEFALKFATYIVETGSTTAAAYDSVAWADLERIQLHEAIRRARAAGLIGEEHEKHLLAFKDDVRNPYSHYNIQKICRPWRWDGVHKMDLTTGEIVVEDAFVAEDPVLQAQAKPIIDEQQSMKVIKFADRVVHHVFAEAWKIVPDPEEMDHSPDLEKQ